MSKKLSQLMRKRTDLLLRQSVAMRQIIDKSVDPEEATELLNEVIFTASEHRELITAIDAEIERARKSWWERFLA